MPQPDNPDESRTTLEPEYPPQQEEVKSIEQEQIQLQISVEADLEVAKEKELCWADGCGKISTT